MTQMTIATQINTLTTITAMTHAASALPRTLSQSMMEGQFDVENGTHPSLHHVHEEEERQQSLQLV